MPLLDNERKVPDYQIPKQGELRRWEKKKEPTPDTFEDGVDGGKGKPSEGPGRKEKFDAIMEKIKLECIHILTPENNRPDKKPSKKEPETTS